jgi:hypothetical protein
VESTHDYISPITDDQKKEANRFIQLVWRGTASAAFAVQRTRKTNNAASADGLPGDIVVGLYCQGATFEQALFQANVGGDCIQTSGSDSYDECLNAANKKAADAKRAQHGAAPLTEDNATAAALQSKLNAITTKDWKNGELDLPGL